MDDHRFHWTVEISGLRRSFDVVVTEQHAEERIAWRSVTGPEHGGVVSFHKLTDADTRVTVQLSWRPQDLAERAAALAQLDDLQVLADLQRFKDYIENWPVPETGRRDEVAREA